MPRFNVWHIRDGVMGVQKLDDKGEPIWPVAIFGPSTHRNFPLMTGTVDSMQRLLEGHEQQRLSYGHSPCHIDDGLEDPQELIWCLDSMACNTAREQAPHGRIIAGADDLIELFELAPTTQLIPG